MLPPHDLRHVFFLFVGEGTIDDGLIRPLEKLCILCGSDEASGTAVDWQLLSEKPPRAVAERVRAARKIEPTANLVFVHRDADAPDPEPRLEEIREALETLELTIPGVPVVPVQETETWLLVDEASIRRVAENPRGRMDLGLPRSSQIESVTDPKALLEETLNLASGLEGRRLKRFKRSFAQRRRMLLERLDPEGPVSELPAWQRLRVSLKGVIQNAGQH